jgi:hypothetical protein
MVVLKGNQEKIDRLIWLHQQEGKTYKEFREEDLNHQITAVVFEPTNDKKMFKKYRLL